MYDRDYSEKRDFIRMYVDAKIRFCRVGESDYHEGSSNTLSGNGISFVTAKKLNLGEQINATLSSAQASVPPLEMKVSIVRVEDLGNGQFEVAGCISDQR